MKKTKGKFEKETKTILITAEIDVIDAYRGLCKEHGLNMSQRIRNFINEEITNLRKEG